MKKQSLFLWVLVVLGLTLLGCDRSESSLGPVTTESILGKWYYRHLVQRGSMSLHLTIPRDTTIVTNLNVDTTFTGTEYYVEIRADGRFNAVVPVGISPAELAKAAGLMTSGTWSLSGSTLTTIMGLDTARSTVGISGGQLTTVTQTTNSSSSEGSTFRFDQTATITHSR